MAMDKRMKCLLCRIHEETGEALDDTNDKVRMADYLRRIRRAAALALLGEFSGLDQAPGCCDRFGDE